jgi:glutamate-5-semialdehyde dehydrogenase
MTAIAAENRNEDVAALMARIGAAAKAASAELAGAGADAKNRALTAAAGHLRDQAESILAANSKDMAAGRDKGLSSAMLDRLGQDAVAAQAHVPGAQTFRQAAERPGSPFQGRRHGPLSLSSRARA